MGWGKKGEAEEDMFWFALFYLPLLAAVCIALVIFPRTLMETSLEPVPLDQAIQARQLNARLWVTDENTGRTSPFAYTDDLSKADKVFAAKQMAYSISIDGKKAHYNKQFYDIAKPIAPFRYLGYTENRNVKVNGATKQLQIEIYQPHKYEIKK